MPTIDKTPRAAETRSTSERKRSWKPSSSLEAPQPKDGYKHRWIRTIEDGKHAGVIGVGGLMLTKVPDEIHESRTEYFSERTKDAMDAVDNDLMKEEHPSMPLSKNRQTSVTFGGGSK